MTPDDTLDIDRHQTYHGWGRYPAICPYCRAERSEEAEQREVDHANDIKQLRQTLRDAATDARHHVNLSTTAAHRLTEIYDAEFTEGSGGPDIVHDLETAARALRNVVRTLRTFEDH